MIPTDSQERSEQVIEGYNIMPAKLVRNLGVLLDSDMSLEEHVNSICRTAYYHLHNIGKIRGYLDKVTAEQLIQAFVTTRLDYCNSLLFSIPNSLELINKYNMYKMLLLGCSLSRKSTVP